MLEEIRVARHAATSQALRDACERAIRDVVAAIVDEYVGLKDPTLDGESDKERGLLGLRTSTEFTAW